MHRLTTLAAAFALAAAPAFTTFAQQDSPLGGTPRQQPNEPARTLPQQDPQPGQQPATAPGAQRGAQVGQAPQGQQGMNDQLFAMAAASAGVGEIGISQLALERAQGDEARQFAERMIQDHTQANQQLMRIAQSKGIELPQRPDLKDTATAMALSVCDSSKFDQEFFKQQVAAHILAVGLFKSESEHGQDPEIREFASSTLPKLEEHLQMARQHAGEAGAGTPGAHGAAPGAGHVTPGATGTTPGTPGASPGATGDPSGEAP